MSTFVKRGIPREKGLKLALILGAVWAVVLAVIWFAYRNQDGDGGGFLNFIGRFHVLIVHVPIGVIFLGFGMDLLSRLTAFAHLRKSLPFVLWISFLSAIAATVVGYLLMSVEGFGGRAMDMHMYFGLAVVVCTFLAVFFVIRGQNGLTTAALAAATFTTMASGHFGGAMVHDTEYLTEHAPEGLKPLLLAGIEKQGDAAEASAVAETEGEAEEIPLAQRNAYTDFVVPILEAKCNECHNENKVKGKLRMDTHELLLAGAEGSDFPTVIPGDADESELIVRVTLPEDDDEFMPPKGEGLTAEEIQFLSLWIAAGAKSDITVAELGDDPSIEAAALAVQAIHANEEEVAGAVESITVSLWDTLSPEEQAQRMEDVLAAAAKYNFSVMPISAEDERLRVNVINAAKEFGDEQLALLEPVADRILWLDLARSQVTDAGMKSIGMMKQLERLHLENTSVTDEGLAQLGSLTNLNYLNLYGTGVTDGAFAAFEKMPSLRKIYVWQTGITSGAAKAYERSVNLEINTGVELAVAAESKEEEAQAAAPAPKPEEKKPEPKPEAKPAAKPAPKPAEKKPEAKPADKPAEKKPEPKTAAKPSEKKPEAKPAAKPEAKPVSADKPAEKKPASQPAKQDAPKPAPAAKPAEKKETPPAPKPAPAN